MAGDVAHSGEAGRGRTILSVQYLRAVAACLVVLSHVADRSPFVAGLMPPEVGAVGVDLFFVISGFIVVTITRRRERDPGQFLLNRVVRIVPIYWFFTIGTAALILVAPALFRANEASLRHLALSLLFVPHEIAAAPGVLHPMVKVGWSLIFEMGFYVVFALSLASAPLRRAHAVEIGLAALGFAGLLVPPGRIYLAFLFNSLILEFVLGMLIARHGEGLVRRLPPAAAWLLVAGGAVLLLAGGYARPEPRGLWLGIPAAAVVLGALALERAGRVGRHPGALLVGDASYSLYLVHVLPIVVLSWLWTALRLPGLATPTGGLAFAALALALAVAAGLVSYLAVERPLTGLVRAAVTGRAPRLTPASRP